MQSHLLYRKSIKSSNHNVLQNYWYYDLYCIYIWKANYGGKFKPSGIWLAISLKVVVGIKETLGDKYICKMPMRQIMNDIYL